MRYKKGFTLVELAIVLIIIGLLLSIGVTLFTILVKSAKLRDTRTTVKTVCEAVKSYAITNKTLPSNLNGLGVRTKDAYGQNLEYDFASGLDTNNFCESNGSWISVVDRGVTKNKVAFIVYSISENRHDDTDTGSGYEIKEPGTPVGSYEYDDEACYIDIDSLRKEACEPLKITTDSLPVGTQYQTYLSTSIEASVSGITCSISGLPSGLTSSGCSVSGTPTQAGTFQVNVTVTDSIGRTANKTFGLVINPNPVRIATTHLPYAYKDQSYNVALTATGATGNYNWSFSGLPTGLSGNSSGVISGTPTVTGIFNVSIQVCDSSISFSSECDSKTLPLTVIEVSSVSGGGSGGGGGGGGGGCTAYTLRIIQATYSSDYIESIKTTAGCVNLSDKRFDESFTLVPQTVKLYRSSNCRNKVMDINLLSFDNDNDCNVYILCNGDKDRCINSNFPKVYCYRAKFESEGRIYIKAGSRCTRNLIIQGSSILSIYQRYRDCRRNSNQLCTYNFDELFSLSEDTDLDCKVEIDRNCIVTND